MDREQIDGWCEKAILGVVLGILVFAPLALGGNRTWEFLVIQGLTVGMMALWAARLWLAARPRLLWPPVCWAVLAFMLYAVARYFTADIEYVARGELIRVLVFGFLFFGILNNLHRQEQMQTILFTLIFLGMLISFYAGWQFFAKSQRVWNLPNPNYVGRGSGTFIYPNLLAGFLEMLVPVGLCFALMGRLPHVLKIMLGYASLVMAGGIAVTLSRGGYASLAVALLALCILLLCLRDYRIHGLVLLGGLFLGVMFFAPRAQVMQQRVDEMFSNGRVDNLRLAIWLPAIKMWRDHFWWGAGPGHFDFRFAQYRPAEVQLQPQYAHNDYLNALADYGLAGTLLILAALVLSYWGVIKIWRPVQGPRDDFSRKKSNKFALLLGASLGLLAILTHSLMDFNLHMASNAILAVTLLAFVSSLWRFATERYWQRLNLFHKCLCSLVLLAGIIFLAATGERKAREYAWLQKAEAALEPMNSHTSGRIAALENARRVEPMNAATCFEIGECYRLKSWEGGDDYLDLAKKAMAAFQLGMKLNPYDQYDWEGYGMCVDWMGRYATEEAYPYYQRANELDPNGYFTTANIGWHYAQIEDWTGARSWFTRSRTLQWSKTDNAISYNYLEIIEKRLKDAAARNQ